MRVDEEDYPLLEWAERRDLAPDRYCTLCSGEGVDGDLPCRCLADSCFSVFAAAAEEASPIPSCRRCDGDGEDFAGRRCLCLLADLRLQQEALEPGESVDD